MDLTDLRALPKVDLHRHLEGAVRLSTILELAREAGTPLAATPEELAPQAQVLAPMASLAEVLTYFRVAQEAFRSLDAVERIAFEAVEDLAADHVRLAELRFSPDFLCRPAALDWDAAFEAILAGAARATSEGHDVALGFIAIVSRACGMDSARRTVEFALRNRDRLVGFDLADDEMAWPPARFARVLAPLREAGLPLTAHYGEAGPPSYPREAIEVLGVARLGHGCSVAQDPDVVALARDRGVTLEMCPTSNERTRAVPSLAAHPARRLLHDGVRVTLNTDDPGLFGIDLTHELEVARDVLGFDRSDLAAVTRTAIEASFLPPEVKARVRSAHFGWVQG